MSATYPAAVRTFSPKQDATMFIMAGHINDLQDEVAAIERTVGTIPTEWDNEGGVLVQLYPSVRARLDAIQNGITIIQDQIASMVTLLNQIGPLTARVVVLETSVATLLSQVAGINNTLAQINATLIAYGARITALENNTGGLSGAIQNLQNQVNALQSGQAAFVRNTGQVVAPDPYQWRVLNWNSVVYDNAGIYLGGSNLVCPQDGWWIINLMGIMENTRSGAGSPTQSLANLSLRIDGNEIASTSEELELGIGGYFRMNVPWAGPWYRGSSISAAINFNPWSGSNPSISAQVSFTRMHGL